MGAKVDLEWNDSDALPPVFDVVTQFVFDRMTDITLEMFDYTNMGKILDVGCGMGIDASELAKRGNDLIGLEPSNIMLKKANDWAKRQGVNIRLVQGIGEGLPFKKKSFENVICKGAIDHFYNPDMAIKEMAQATKPNGRVIISVTNYESLGCITARTLMRLRSLIFWKNKRERTHWNGYGRTKTHRIPGRDTCSGNNASKDRKPWDIPLDHTYKFDYFVLKNVLNKYMEVESLVGVSLFWNLPGWRELMERLPKSVALSLLTVADKIARKLPLFSDVLVSRCRVKNDIQFNDQI